MLIVTAFCTFSCNDADNENAKNAYAYNEKQRANSKEIYKAMVTGDVSKLDSFFVKDFIDHGDMNDVVGVDSLKTLFKRYHNQIKDLKMESIAEATDGDYHFAYYRMTGTANDDSMGVPAGTELDLTGVDLVKLKDGKAAEHWGFIQGRDMMKMMSLNPVMKPCMDKMMQAAPTKSE